MSGCTYQSQTTTNTFQEGEFVHVSLCAEKRTQLPSQGFQGDVRINSNVKEINVTEMWYSI